MSCVIESCELAFLEEVVGKCQKLEHLCKEDLLIEIEAGSLLHDLRAQKSLSMDVLALLGCNESFTNFYYFIEVHTLRSAKILALPLTLLHDH